MNKKKIMINGVVSALLVVYAAAIRSSEADKCSIINFSVHDFCDGRYG